MVTAPSPSAMIKKLLSFATVVHLHTAVTAVVLPARAAASQRCVCASARGITSASRRRPLQLSTPHVADVSNVPYRHPGLTVRVRPDRRNMHGMGLGCTR